MNRNIFDYLPVSLSKFFGDSYFHQKAYGFSLEYDSYGNEALAEQSLWQRVILQAIIDATSAPINARARIDKTRAILWFSLNNKDFMTVCDMAGKDPVQIISRTKQYIKKHRSINRRKFYLKRSLGNKRDNHKGWHPCSLSFREG